MQNGYLSNDYQDTREESLCYYKDERMKDFKVTPLIDRYMLHQTTYNGEILGFPKIFAHNKIYKDTQFIFEYNCIDMVGDFCSLIIDEIDNKQYFVFREDLYGYSVFDINEKIFFRFFPQMVLDRNEDFIWTDIKYNQKTRLCIVDGCYWAAPNSLLVIDFSNPMIENKYLDINSCLKGGYDNYENINFKEFSDTAVHITAYNLNSEIDEDIAISFDECREWLRVK